MPAKTEKPICFFDANGTGYAPHFISHTTKVDVAAGCYSVNAKITKKGRNCHHKVGDPSYVDIPKDFMDKHYPDLVAGGNRYYSR